MIFPTCSCNSLSEAPVKSSGAEEVGDGSGEASAGFTAGPEFFPQLVIATARASKSTSLLFIN